MEDEADRLRRANRAHSVDPTLLVTPQSRSQSSGNNSRFQFPPPPTSRPPSVNANKTAARPKPRSKGMEVDTLAPVEENETPQIQRNKKLREGAMAAITETQEEEDNGRSGRSTERTTPSRRRSSVGRGKRMSTSFEATGVISAYAGPFNLLVTDLHEQLNHITLFPKRPFTSTSTPSYQMWNEYDICSSGAHPGLHRPT
jgi:kinetochore protein Mis13/DSN1